MKRFLLILLPLSSILGTYAFPISTPVGSLYLFRLLAILSFIYVLLINGLKVKLIKDKSTLYAIVFALFWILWGITSFFWTLDLPQGVQELLSLLLWLFIILTLTNIKGSIQDKVIALAQGWTLGFIVCFILGLWEWFTGNHLPGSYASELPDYVTYKVITGTLGNPNNFGATIVLAWPLVFIYLQKLERSNVRNTAVFLLLVSSAILVIVSASRLAIIAFALQIVLLIILQSKNSLKTVRNFFILFSTLYIVNLIAPSNLLIFSKFNTLIQMGFSGQQSASYRLNMFLNGINMSLESYGAGIGAGSFEKYISLGYGLYPVDDVTNPHNFLIEILGQYGFFVFLGFVILYLSLVFKLFSLRRYAVNSKQNNQAMIYNMAIISTIAYLIVSSANSSYMTIPVNWMFLSTIILIAHSKSNLNQIDPTTLKISETKY